ncbi:MAG TPA: homoserine dehydrogenase [Firmicutes bacterium]|nr:homoserine dehydrogenase [Bacillota bacterium]
MINIAIFGFGVVGGGTAEVLTQNEQLISERVGDKINIKYILDLRDFPGHPLAGRVVHDIDVILSDPEVKICAELMGGSHPAFEFSERALKAGKSVVTSNKEVVANFGPELLRTAAENNVRYLFEASVGGGIPVIHPIGSCLTANDITEVDGILNGTTNYILTKMISEGSDFETALAEAQQKGYAERNPAADVDGIDTCRKISILSAIAFGKLVPPEKILTEGIRAVSLVDVANAAKLGYVVKLIGKTVRVGDKISACVSPTLVSRSNPLANINDVYNGILVNGNAIGDVMFYGRGAGKLPTASAVVSDIIDIATYLDHPVHSFHVWERLSDDEILPAEELESRFYLRFASKPETLSGLPCPSVVSDETDNFALVCGKTTLKSLRDRYGDCTIMRLL